MRLPITFKRYGLIFLKLLQRKSLFQQLIASIQSGDIALAVPPKKLPQIRNKEEKARKLVLSILISSELPEKTLATLITLLFQLDKHQDLIDLKNSSDHRIFNSIRNNLYTIQSLIHLNRIDEAFSLYLAQLKAHENNKQLDNPKIIRSLASESDGASYSKVTAFLESRESELHSVILSKLYSSNGNLNGILALSHNSSNTTREIRKLLSVKQYAENTGESYATIGTKELIPLASNENWKTSHKNVSHIESNTPYVACLENVFIHGGSDLIFAPENTIISDNLADEKYGKFIDLTPEPNAISQKNGEILVTYPHAKGRLISEGFMLSGASSKHFGHWFSEYIPKLLYFLKKKSADKTPLLIDDTMPQQHVEMLMAITPNPLIKLFPGERVEVSKLWTAPTTTFRSFRLHANHKVPVHMQGALSPSILKNLRKRVMSTISVDKAKSLPSRIYLQRGHNAWREFKNEDEAIQILKRFDFTEVCLGNLSFTEQVEILSQATHIAGPNGSSFNNLIYADPNVNIIILQSRSYDWSTGLGALKELGYNPTFIENAIENHDGPKHSSFSLDLRQIEKTIKRQTV